jgi:RHS repeat-associated protein
MRKTVALLAIALVACEPAPTPSRLVTPPPSAAPRVTTTLALEECDQLGYVPCEHRAVLLKLPVAGAGVSLTYSSELMAGRLDRPREWERGSLGLGGWSLDVLASYDRANHVLIHGNGAWRTADAVALPSGEIAVPSFDGRFADVFDAAGRHVRTVDAILGIDLITFTYDGSGRLLTAKGSISSRPIDLTVERRDDGAPIALRGAGNRTAVSLDNLGHLSLITGADGAATVLVNTEGGLVELVQGPTSGLTGYEYDESGRLTEVHDPDGVVLRYEGAISDSAVETRISLPLGGQLSFAARTTAAGIERSFTGAGGATDTLVEAPDGQRSVHLADGTVVAVGLRPDDRWALSAPIVTPQVTTRADGVVQRVERAVALTFAASDPLHPSAWSRTTTIDDQAWVDRFDPAARTRTVTDPSGLASSTTYDTLGRIVGRSIPGEPATTWEYDASGRLARSTIGAGATAVATAYAYLDEGRVTISRSDGTTDVIVVDPAGRVVQHTAGDGSNTLMSFDAGGLPILVRPGGLQATTLGWSAAGRATGYVPPVVSGDPSFQSVAYDTAGRPELVSGPGSRRVETTYDDIGRIDGISFDRGRLVPEYDPAGRLTRVLAPDGVGVSYTYVGDLRTATQWDGPIGGSVNLTFDGFGRVVGEAVSGGPTVTSTYDDAGRLIGVGPASISRDPASGAATRATLGTASVAWAYDADGRPASISTSAGGATLGAITYVRDALGRIATATQTFAGVTHTIEYGYDRAGRLASVTQDHGPAAGSTYDRAGNRLSIPAPGGSGTATYDTRNQLVRLGTVTYSYEPGGTLARRDDGTGSTSFDFDDLGAIRSIRTADGRQIDYVVDWTGRPIGRKVNGNLVAGYLYRPDGILVAELDGSGSVVARFGYDEAGHLISIDRDGHAYVVMTDLVGSPRLVVDSASGAAVQAMDYDAWGRVVSDSNPGFQPFGFGGGLLDPDTGLVRLGARLYDPGIGRWIQPDPVGYASGETNLYLYAGNDPVNQSDPGGLQPVKHPKLEDHGCFNDDPAGGEDICWSKDEDTGRIRYDLPPGGKFWFCEDGVCYLCGSGIRGGGDCSAEPQDPYNDLREPAPKPDEPAPDEPGRDPGSCVLAIYCGNHTCIALLCNMPGGGVCFIYCSSGDPHLRTADGLSVSFQGAGEYLMIASADGSAVIQARQEPPSGATLISVTTAVAALVAGDRVGVYLGDGLALHVNGKAVDGTEAAVQLPKGGTVIRRGLTVVVEWPDGSRLTVDQSGNHLDYGFLPDADIAPGLVGLLGAPNGDVADDLVSRDGALRLDPGMGDFFEQLHGPFGTSWRVTQAESLFDYRAGESTATFTLPDIPHASATTNAVPEGARAAAEAVCRAAGISSEPTLDECIVDVGLTGDASFAASASAVQASTDAAPPKAAPEPVALGSSVAGQTTSADDRRTYSFFVARAGQAVYLDALRECESQLSWSLVDPNGSSMAQEFVCNDIGRKELAQAGTYTIKVFAPTGSDAFGAFAFAVVPAGDATRTPIELGQHVTGSVANLGDQPTYTFEAGAGQIVFADASGPCVTDLTWRLVSPSGSSISLQETCSDIGRRELEAGTYTIVVGSSRAATGTFEFTIYPVPPPRTTSTSIGASISDGLAAVGEEHRYTFAASVGQNLIVDASGPCVDDLGWRLRDPNGVPLRFGNSCEDLGPVTLSVGGEYTIEISSGSIATGQYQFVIGIAPT